LPRVASRLYREDAVTLTSRIARPLVWTDRYVPWPKILAGASCFILRFESRLVGVTADHVVRAFEKAERQARELVGILRTSRLDLSSVVIDRNPELDIATFEVSEEQLRESEALAVDCRGEWPPPAPERGQKVSFAGFPEAFKRECSPTYSEFRLACSMAEIVDLSEDFILATYNPEVDSRILAAPGFAEVDANWSGCSGGPMLMYVEGEEHYHWYAAGIIVQGPGTGLESAKSPPQGAMQGIDKFWFRRSNVIKEDGTLNGLGWLPGANWSGGTRVTRERRRFS
jgi:hypothetical protein